MRNGLVAIGFCAAVMTAEAPFAQGAADGAAVYQRACAACHAMDGPGPVVSGGMVYVLSG